MRTRSNTGMTALQTARIERILSATKKLLGELGPERMTMRDIAAASRVAEGTLYNRFGTKDNLVSVACVDYFETRVRRPVELHPGKTAVDKVVVTADAVARAATGARRFTRGLMNTWFDTSSGRVATARLAETIASSWMPLLLQMAAQKSLAPWASLKMLSEELCDREFGVVVKWAQDRIPDRRFRDHLAYALLVPLLGVSRGPQARDIEERLAVLTRRLDRKAGG